MISRKKILRFSMVILTLSVFLISLPKNAFAYKNKRYSRNNNKHVFAKHHNDRRYKNYHPKYTYFHPILWFLSNLPRKVVVVHEPEVVEPVLIASNNVSYVDNEYLVNLPNSNGSYTTVKIRRYQNGYLGPQGEFYYEFPAVEQLRIMYGK